MKTDQNHEKLVCMVFQGSFMVFMVLGRFPWFYKVVSWFFIVFGWFPWFFKVVSWFIMVLGWFPWFFKVVSWFIMVFGWFPWFSRWFHGFSLFLVSYHGFVG